MKNCLRLLLPLLIYIMPYAAVAQNCNSMVFGAIRDSQDRSLLPGAGVVLKETGVSSVTDTDGHYHLNNLCPGKYTLVISYVGYQTKEVAITISTQKELNISLINESQGLKTVSIEGQRTELKPLQLSARLDGKSLEMTRGESLGESLKVIPGVNSIQTGPTISKPVIQGLYGNRVLIYNAGVRQEGQQWGSEHAPEVDPFIASQITVVKGAASVMYGAEAIGGVVLVEPAPLEYTPGVTGKVNLVGMTNSGLGALSSMLEGSPDKNHHFSWRIQGTGRIAGNSKTADYYLKNTGLREYNGAFLLGYRNKALTADLYASTFNTKLAIFSGSNVGSTEDRNSAIGRDEPLAIYQSDLNYTIERPYQDVNHHLVKLRAGYNLPNTGTLNLQYSYQQNYRKEYDVVRASSEDNYQYRFDLNTQVLDASFDHQPVLGFSGRVGVNAISQHNYYDGAYLIPFFKSYSGAAYLIERWSWQKLEMEAGFRYDKKWMEATKRISPRDNNSPIEKPEFNFNQLSATLGAAYNLPGDYRLTGTFSKGWRPPSINELFIEGVHQGNAAFERGDRSLQEEKSLNLSAGISKQIGHLTGSVEVYRNQIDGYIYLQPQLDASGVPIFEITQRGGFLAYQYVQINSRFTGMDATVNYDLNDRFRLTGKFASVRAYNTDNDEHLIYIPADKFTGALRYSLPDTKRFKTTTIDFEATHVSRQSKVRDNQDFTPAPDAYTLVGASVASSLPVKGYNWNLSLSVNNLFNANYRDYLNRFRYYSADLGRNIILRLQIPFGNKQ
ncbi:MAG: TonB-dependent receptor [Pedobacter sp.]